MTVSDADLEIALYGAIKRGERNATMTDNSTATDEALFALEHRIASARRVSGCMALMITPDEAAALIARIRAETAKNSGEPVAWLSNSGSECFSLTLEDAKRRYGTGSRHIPLYTQPTPANSPLGLTEKQIDAAQFCLSEFFPKTDGVTLRIAAKETVEAALDIATPANSRAEAIGARTNYHIVFDGFPAPDGPRFVELENDAGRSISAGEWKRRADGLTELVIPTVRDEELRKAVRSVIASLKADYSHDDDGYGAAESLERALLEREGE